MYKNIRQLKNTYQGQAQYLF